MCSKQPKRGHNEASSLPPRSTRTRRRRRRGHLRHLACLRSSDRPTDRRAIADRARIGLYEGLASRPQASSPPAADQHHHVSTRNRPRHQSIHPSLHPSVIEVLTLALTHLLTHALQCDCELACCLISILDLHPPLSDRSLRKNHPHSVS